MLEHGPHTEPVPFDGWRELMHLLEPIVDEARADDPPDDDSRG